MQIKNPWKLVHWKIHFIPSLEDEKQEPKPRIQRREKTKKKKKKNQL